MIQRDSAALPADELAAWLRREGERRYHDQHPFHVLMHEGKLTRSQLQRWVLNRRDYTTISSRWSCFRASPTHFSER